MKVLSAETNLSSATNVGNASVVRIFNSDSSAATVTRKDSGGSTIGTFTVGAGEVIYCEKNYTDTLEGGSTLKVSKTAYSHMMSYSSYSSGGGGGGSGIITTNLVLHLDAGNNSSYSGSGTSWNDISGNGNNFTLLNGPTYTSDNGGAIVFDGTNDSAVSALNQSFFQFGTGDYSYGVWVKFDTLGDFKGIITSGRGTEQGTNDYVGSWQLDTESGAVKHKFGSTTGSNIVLTSSLNPSIGTWYYIFIVNDRSENELKLYVNGSLNTTSSHSQYGSVSVGNFSNTTSIYNIFNVGRNRNQDSFFDGAVGQVHVYKGKALTASEVLQNYDASKSRYGY